MEVILTRNLSKLLMWIRKISDTPMEEEEEEEKVEDFEYSELEHNLAFKVYCKRLSCFAHTLQLVMTRFNKCAFQPFLSKLHKLVKRVNKSSKATEKLLSQKVDRRSLHSVELYFFNDGVTFGSQGTFGNYSRATRMG